MKYVPHILIALFTLYMLRWAYRDIKNENRPEVNDDDIMDAWGRAHGIDDDL